MNFKFHSVPDFYQQPEYLKEVENSTTTSTPDTVQYTNSTETYDATAAPRRNRVPLIILGVVGIIIILVIVLLLSNRTTNNTNNQTSDQPIVLQWWGVFMDDDVVQPLLDEYKTVKPNVTIEYANNWPQGSYNDAADIYKSELNRVLKANDQVEIPDIFMIDSTWVGDYEKYAKVSSSYDVNTFRSSFHDVVATNFVFNNQVYGVPLWIDNLAIIYNKDLLAAQATSTPPQTWSSFKTLAQNLTKRSGSTITQAGFASGISANVSYSAELLQLLMIQNGVTLTDAQGQPSFSTDSDTVTALDFYKGFVNSTAGTWNNTFTNDAASFLEGKTAMITATSYRLRDILNFNELYDINIDIGIAPIPQINTGNDSKSNWADYWGNMVAINRPNSTAAWDFLKWITEPEQLKKLSDNVKTQEGYFGILYPRKDMVSELNSDTYLQVYNEYVPYSKSWYMVKGLEVEAEFNKLIDATSASQTQIAQTENAIQTLISQKGKI